MKQDREEIAGHWKGNNQRKDGSIMGSGKKMNLAVGSLLLVGFIMIQGGVVLQIAGLNLLDPLFKIPSSAFLIANTCFLVALIIDRFS